jgi:hypothetical protein
MSSVKSNFLFDYDAPIHFPISTTASQPVVDYAAISSPSSPVHSNDSCVSANHARDLKCSDRLGHAPKYLHDFHYNALINHDSSVSNSIYHLSAVLSYKNLSNLQATET